MNIKINPITQDNEVFIFNLLSEEVSNQVKTLIPVGIAITIVAAVKYARLSASIPVTYI
ncbi:MAG: hypothetical protein ACTHKC_09635 [Candidatus Nitrosocosmicus sp.]